MVLIWSDGPKDGEMEPSSPEISQPVGGESTVNDGVSAASTANDDEIAALRAIVEGTARSTGEVFFESLVRHLASAVGVSYAFVAEFAGAKTRVRTIAFWGPEGLRPNVEFDLARHALRGRRARQPLPPSPAGSGRSFPSTRDLVDLGVESYLGVPLLGRRRKRPRAPGGLS